MNCTNCNKVLPDGSRFCSNCGTRIEFQSKTASQKENKNIVQPAINIKNNQNFPYSQNQRANVLRKLAEYENISGIIWIVIGIIQCFSLIGVICGVWNIIVGIQRLKYSKELSLKPEEIYINFEGQLTSLIIILVINVFFGALIGVIGAIFDLFVRNYVIENKHLFDGSSVMSNVEPQKNVNNNVSEIKALKELLDNGILTQEEFDAKKKELLNL